MVGRTRADATLRREADMMGFYVAVALIAALSTGDDHAAHSQFEVLAIVWGTTVGLAVVHWFALFLSVHVVHDPGLHHTPVEMLFAQLVMAIGVAMVASAVVAVLSEDLERLGARLTAALFIAGLVGFESRKNGLSRGRATAYAVVAVILGVAIAAVKWFLGR